jgi:predicted nucleic acid-binding protein
VVVADASALVDALIRRGPRGDWAASALAGNVAIAAPHLVDPEFMSAIMQLVRRRMISVDYAGGALRSFGLLRIRRFPVTGLLDRLWDLREALSPYDATYVALAEALDVPLVTTDVRLARSHGHSARIVAFSP